VGVWVARVPSGELVYANRTFAEIMGMAVRDDVAKGEYATPYGIHDREGRLYPEGRMPFVQALEAGETVTADDIVIHRPDGRKVYVRAQAKPLKDDSGTQERGELDARLRAMPDAGDERLMFHELIHVVQARLVGLTGSREAVDAAGVPGRGHRRERPPLLGPVDVRLQPLARRRD